MAHNSQIRNANLQLSGDLGAGKSTFARYLLRSLGVQGNIKSPTYSVVEEYLVKDPFNTPEGKLNIWHFDFYRFNEPGEWEDAGFKDIFLSEGLKISEWSEKAKGFIPDPDLYIDFQIIDNDTRLVNVTTISDKGQLLLV